MHARLKPARSISSAAAFSACSMAWYSTRAATFAQREAALVTAPVAFQSPAATRSSAPGRLDQITEQSESGGRRYGGDGQLLRSHVGAMGEMQVMPATARDPGYGVRPWDGRSPDDLARTGRDYRAAMQAHYNGDLARMWGAYNAGPGRVDSLISQHGNEWLRHAPADTQKYVRNNLRKVGFR